MKSPLCLLLVGVFGTVCAFSQSSAPAQKIPGFEPVEAAFREDLQDVPDVPNLPRVLLIGDSISIGYTRGVRARLAGRANVHRPPENCGATTYGLVRLDSWLGTGHWAVIHFNFGLHDLKYLDTAGNYRSPADGGKQVTPLAEYATHLRTLVQRLRQSGATLIFATTTPVPPGTQGRIAGDETAYNATALEIMHENGIVVDDLHEYVASNDAKIQLPENVHFTSEGYAQLARVVADRILSALPPPSPAP